MKAISAMIREGLKENAKELKEELLDLKTVQDINKSNSSFNFDISIFYNNDTKLLEIKYTFTKEQQQISIRFEMSELSFNFNSIEISVELIKYAISYFNKTDYKVNIGNFDGDNYTGIKGFINSFYGAEENSNLCITDDILEEEI